MTTEIKQLQKRDYQAAYDRARAHGGDHRDAQKEAAEAAERVGRISPCCGTVMRFKPTVGAYYCRTCEKMQLRDGTMR